MNMLNICAAALIIMFLIHEKSHEKEVPETSAKTNR